MKNQERKMLIERLKIDMRTLKSDSKELLGLISEEIEDELSRKKRMVSHQIFVAKEKVLDASEKARAVAVNALRGTDDYVTENPWKSMGFALIAGITVGMVIKRK